MFDLKTLKTICLEAIKSQMNVENFFDLFEIPDTLRSGDLTEAIIKFLGRNIEELMLKEEMRRLVEKHPHAINEILEVDLDC